MPTLDVVPKPRIGISGWTYPRWRGDFYPPGLPHKRELEYASRRLNSIEVNGTFYALQRPASFHTWYQGTPADFVFSVKAPRFITHMLKLRNAETAVANFFASGVLALREKLGPILWQLPPNFGFDAGRLSAFFSSLPGTTTAAAAVAAAHDTERMRDRTWTAVERDAPLRHALEVRHASFATAEFVALLRELDVALVTADTAGKWPFMEDQTTDFSYVRLHGDAELYVSGYDDEALDVWAGKVRAWAGGADAPSARLVAPTGPLRAAGREVFVYFDNDVKVRAPRDAMNLARRLGVAQPAQ
jgi:uncharacterized protein YecE (DUF72 family)